MSFAFSQVKPNVSVIAHAVFGILTPFQDEFNDAIKSLKDQLRGINTRLSGDKCWIVGNQCTIVDIYLAGLLTTSF